MSAARSQPTPAELDKLVLSARAAAEAGAAQVLAAPGKSAPGTDRLPVVVKDLAYQAWHTRLFARFLQAAGRPGVGHAPVDDEPLAAFPVDAAQALERLLDSLSPAFFLTPRNLGWMYQAWQQPERSERPGQAHPNGAGGLAAATRFFTEDYLVHFLLENTLGAWWAARRPHSPLVAELAFLRRGETSEPASGNFPGWPKQPAAITVLDPCCGSGHFLSAAFHLLWRMRMEAEGLNPAAAAAAVLRDNLFGLDLDPRGAQITVQVLQLEAWAAGGPAELPPVNVFPVGPVQDLNLYPFQNAGESWPASIERVLRFFGQVPEAGSLLDPNWPVSAGGLPPEDRARWAAFAPQAASPEAGAPGGAPAAWMYLARAAALLARRYVLVATNVPYLARHKQPPGLKSFLHRHYPTEKADLATAFLRRSLQFLQPGGAAALLTPQNWLFLGAYQAMRRTLLAETQLVFLAKIGEWGFHSGQAAGAFTTLIGLVHAEPTARAAFFGLDASGGRTPAEKAHLLQSGPLKNLSQAGQARHPEARLLLEADPPGWRLGDYARSLVGLQTGDNPYYLLRFWEVPQVCEPWAFCLTPADRGDPYGGRESILRWESGQGRLASDPGARIQGLEAFGQPGVAVMRVRAIRTFHYQGELYDQNVAVILPHDPTHLPAVRAFCASAEFAQAVRRIDQKLNVTNATLTKVPFDLERWQRVAKALGPPEPPSHRDPRQWLFPGDPAGATEPLQVAVARLLGYRWPGIGGLPGDAAPQPIPTGEPVKAWVIPDGIPPPAFHEGTSSSGDLLASLVIPDGIAPLPALDGVPPAAERLRALLAAAYGPGWSPQQEAGLLAAAGCPGWDLERWLRDRFFTGHCRLFRNRPFIWHLWDGRRDGFAALVNYHRLTAANLKRLISVYLDPWIDQQRRLARERGPAAGRRPAAARLTAAEALRARLEAIQAGEPPYDLYARWKPLAGQPLGWDPDLDDGVRVNLRPFVTAGLLRSPVHLHWKIDRGRNPDGSERLNDLHFSPAEKRTARQWPAY